MREEFKDLGVDENGELLNPNDARYIDTGYGCATRRDVVRESLMHLTNLQESIIKNITPSQEEMLELNNMIEFRKGQLEKDDRLIEWENIEITW